MRITLVGGGSVAASFLMQLVRQGVDALSPPLHIDICDPAAVLGPGQPYATDEPDCTLLNAPPFAMSAMADDKEHFLRWLRTHTPEAVAQDLSAFLPRRLYGAYLREGVDQARAQAIAQGWIWRHHRASAIGIHRTDGGRYHVDLEGREGFDTDQVLLCLGNMPSPGFDKVGGHAAFLDSPYPIASLHERISPDDTVVVLGTSLSAIDVIVALERQGHRGPVHAVSRQGRLPAVRVPSRRLLQLVRLSEPHLRRTAAAEGGRLRWSQVRQFFVEDFFHNGGRVEDLADATRATTDPVAYLEAELAAAQEGPRLWLDLGLQATSVIDLLWHLLDDEGKQAFSNEYQQVWSSRRVSFPVHNAHILLGMLRQRRLGIRGGLADVRPVASGRGLDVLLRDPDGKTRTLHADTVVNATGYGSDVTRSREPLVRQLLSRGLAQPHAFGGFDIDTGTGCLVNASGQQENVAVLGSLACGAYFWTYSMDMNARLAARQVRRLIDAACALATCKPLP